MTRMAVCGRLDAELRRAFDVARAIQDELAAAMVPGAIPSRLYALARERADAAGLGGQFMGPPGAQARFVGHGIGIELDEVPVLAPGFDAPLRAGTTLAVEPKFVFPGLGAVGIENTFAVAEGGGEKLGTLADDLLVVG
jgi:Xaa-Pro aminopeptidase